MLHNKDFFKSYVTFQCLQHRALNPDDALPELSPLIANYLKPPEEVVASCSQSMDKLKDKFKLEVVKKKEEKTGENMFQEKYVYSFFSSSVSKKKSSYCDS